MTILSLRRRLGMQIAGPVAALLLLAGEGVPLRGPAGPWGPRAAAADGVMLVQAGAFWMGSEDGDPDERPMHRVFVRDFWMDRTKVTNREFAAFLDARGTMSAEGEAYLDEDDPDARIRRVAAGGQRGAFAALPGFEDHPAIEVSWFGARDYCLWRGGRLPTEAEWEKAARGEDKRRHPWGDEPPSPARAVYGRPFNATEPTDGRPAGASPHRILDLLGNAREWTASEYRPYPYRAPESDGGPRAPRVVRGASHDDPAPALSVTARRFYEHRGTARGHHHVSFRCATSEDLGGR